MDYLIGVSYNIQIKKKLFQVTKKNNSMRMKICRFQQYIRTYIQTYVNIIKIVFFVPNLPSFGRFGIKSFCLKIEMSFSIVYVTIVFVLSFWFQSKCLNRNVSNLPSGDSFQEHSTEYEHPM